MLNDSVPQEASYSGNPLKYRLIYSVAILNCESIHLRRLKHLLANHFTIDSSVEARPVSGMAGASDLLDPEQQIIAVTIDQYLMHLLEVS